jgi:hypothetical protein
VTLAIGTNPGGGTLSGITTVTAVNGVATFSGLSINRTGPGYTLTASSSGLTGATSAAFNITPGTATRLAFIVQPGNTARNTTMVPAVQVAVQDALGNTVTTSTAAITLTIGNNPGTPQPGVLQGGAATNAVNGVATFSGLQINRAGTGYTLIASSPGLTSVTSSTFNIT